MEDERRAGNVFSREEEFQKEETERQSSVELRTREKAEQRSRRFERWEREKMRHF